MDAALFDRYRTLIHRKCGIVLPPEKTSLLVSRLQRRLRATGAVDANQYFELIESDLSGHELTQLLDAISTNTTYFWREAEHFEIFQNLLREWNLREPAEIKIWCAASSTGQEPYTLAMGVLEELSLDRHQVRILATDVSTRVLRVAHHGVYSAEEIAKLPAAKRNRFLSRLSEEDWKIAADVRQLVLFKRLNLVEIPYPLKGPIDVIFCRNVMIYFDLETRQRIINEFERLLSPGGHLFLSLSESLLGVEHSLERAGPSLFRKGPA